METTQKIVLGNFVYDPTDVLGVGGFGTVWRGHHRDDRDFQVAIKFLSLKDVPHDDLQDAKEGFLREARILRKLQHPSIVRLFDFSWNEEPQPRPYLVMELLAGGSLRDRLKAGPPLMVGQSITLIVQLAQALEVAHSNDVIHRDLKPDNILLRDGELTPVLTDFGISRLGELTRSTSTAVGTPSYMAPEQVEGRAISRSTDVYALGILFYELLTGRVPYWNNNPHALAKMHVELPLPQLPTALASLQPVLDRMLAKDPDDRFPSCEALVGALRQRFLNDAAVRTLVGYAGSGRAWSSQLRALGFELPPEAAAEVRVEQGRSISPGAVHDRIVADASAPESRPSEPSQRFGGSGETPRRGYYRYIGIGAALGLVAAVTMLTGQRAGSPNAAVPNEVEPGAASLVSIFKAVDPATQVQEWLDKGTKQAEEWRNKGTDHYYSRGVAQSYTEAARYYRLAADLGDAKAQTNLGIMYVNGQGVEKNATEAVRWYRLAADQGYADAQFYLGVNYDNGTGVPKDATEAVRWYKLAADQGLAVAQYNVAVSYDNGTGVPKNATEAVRWYRLAADQGYAAAQTTLGGMYRVGQGVKKDATEAVRLYRLAADQGDATAQTNLGYMYDLGTGVKKDATEAVRLYRLAADQGDATAQFNLGSMYVSGTGVPKSRTEAVRWYQRAADQGYADAREALDRLVGE